MLNKLFLLALLLLFVTFVKSLYSFSKGYGKQYHSTIPEVMIEQEYIKTLSHPEFDVYKQIPDVLKKEKLDYFMLDNPDLVKEINTESVQNSVNHVIAQYKMIKPNINYNTDPVKVIDAISTQPFIITLDSGVVLNVVPVIKNITDDVEAIKNINSKNTEDGENVVGVIQYDLDSTIKNAKSQLSIEDESTRDAVFKEVESKITEKINDYVKSGLNSAAATAVATSLCI